MALAGGRNGVEAGEWLTSVERLWGMIGSEQGLPLKGTRYPGGRAGQQIITHIKYAHIILPFLVFYFK